MRPFKKLSSGLDVKKAQEELRKNYHLFGEFGARKDAGTIHSEMDDIWVRYKDLSESIESGDYSDIADEHDSVWLKDLPEIKRLCYQCMTLVDGERLGGVLVTKLPPGGSIYPHHDGGWHAEYYSKIYVPIANKKGSTFGFIGGTIRPEEGDVWMFDNSITHWVKNDTNSERIALIICIKQSKYLANGELIKE